MKKLISGLLILVGITLDQLFKNWIVANFSLGQVKTFIPNVLSLTYLKNDGAAWSSFSGQQWFFMLLTPLVLIVAAYFLWKYADKNWYYWGLTLIISGALGNFIDRIRQGYVVDMFQTEFMNFPIFNIADALLSVGFVILFIAILTDESEKGSKAQK
ncbi:signal peptidase II [Lactococcus fujiensis]|uniref:Lipoprotein signal peptidase n=1 Tax=Lactococcus fujiensis JCM 16395 TaxID=1291764 RepID=A0A2A5RNN4_9LACT|nr:signal peptidase II [Lactococcus fujiensis]PCS00969.1 lipoprotein signal peptidase [Lactococcus fujiensis JCM 16395]